MARFFRLTMVLTKGLNLLTITKCCDQTQGGLPGSWHSHMMESPPATCTGRQARGHLKGQGATNDHSD